MDDTEDPGVAMDRAVAGVDPSKTPDLGKDDQLVDLRLTLDIRRAELELLTASTEVSSELAPLARFAVGKVWLALKTFGSGRLVLSLSLPVLQGTDLRPGLPDSHRYVLCALLHLAFRHCMRHNVPEAQSSAFIPASIYSNLNALSEFLFLLNSVMMVFYFGRFEQLNFLVI